MALLSILGAPAAPSQNGNRNLAVGSLSIEHMARPLGIDAARPRFGWIVDANYNGAAQTAYEIRVSKGTSAGEDVWASGRVDSGDSFDVVYGGAPLESSTRYYWSVRVWDGELSSGWSEPDWFETAFMDVGEFQGEWIGRLEQRQENETPEALLRKEFLLSGGPIEAARVYVCGLGLHKVYINGRRVGDHELDPAFTPFDERVLYVTHDVTDLLTSGVNAVGVSLGRGYYADFGNIDTSAAPWLSEPKLKLQLNVTYADGTRHVVVSDSSWKSADGPTLANSLKYGETYDARLEQPGWNDRGFDDVGWQAVVRATPPTGVLQAQDLEPVRVLAPLPAPVGTRVSEGVRQYDFRTTRAGWATIELKGPAGSAATIKYGERLTDDGLVSSGNRGPFGGRPLQVYTYILRGDAGGESYTPSYSYNGFRFVEIEAPEDVTVVSVVGQILANDLAITGSFDSSDELLNRYHDAMVASLRSNMHHVPTDTPMYEKRGWTADALLVVDSALMNLASENFWEKWMLDHRYNQAEDGGIAVIVPNQNPGEPQEDPFTGLTGDPVWSSSYVLVNYALYQQRGNLRTLEQNYEGMKRWMAKWMGALADTDDVFEGRTWGDHEPAYGSGMNNFLVGTAFVYRSARALAEIADVLGQGEDARSFERFADKVRKAFNAEYYDAQARHYDFPYVAPRLGPPPPTVAGETPSTGGAPPSGAEPAPGGPPPGSPFRQSLPPEEVDARQFQTDNLLPLALGLVPEKDRDALCQQLVHDVEVTHDAHITTGATVLKDVMPVLTDCGAAELAYRAATNPTFPGWGYWFVGLDGTRAAGGETIVVDTFWEAWYEGARSHNHAFRGTIDDWLYQYLAGITPTAPGYREVRIKPYPVGDVTRARASIRTPLGPVSSSWHRQDEAFELEVQVPVGATGEVLVPVRSVEAVTQQGGAEPTGVHNGYAGFKVRSGSYRFVAQR